MKWPHVLVIILFLVLFISLIIQSRLQFDRQENEFVKNKMNEILVEVKDLGRGNCSFKIREHHTKNILAYKLSISWFIKKNDIQVNDSISKDENDNNIIFYKKKNGIFQKCCVEQYYN